MDRWIHGWMEGRSDERTDTVYRLDCRRLNPKRRSSCCTGIGQANKPTNQPTDQQIDFWSHYVHVMRKFEIKREEKMNYSDHYDLHDINLLDCYFRLSVSWWLPKLPRRFRMFGQYAVNNTWSFKRLFDTAENCLFLASRRRIWCSLSLSLSLSRAHLSLQFPTHQSTF